MALRIVNQNAFTSGVLAPDLAFRTDSDEYRKGLKEGINVFADPHGGLRKRNGSKFVAIALNSSRLVDYTYSPTLSYELEFADRKIRFLLNKEQVVETNKAITAITKANPGVITSNTHGFSNGDTVYITDIIGMIELNSSTIPYIVANQTTNTFTLKRLNGLDVDTTLFTTYSSSGHAARIYEIISPYTSSQLPNITYQQVDNKLYLAHPDVFPKQLFRTSTDTWTIEDVPFYPPPTYEYGSSPAVTLTPSAVTGLSINFTLSGAFFLQADVGRQLIDLNGNGVASIVSITSTTVAVCDIITDFASTGAIAAGDWKMDLSPICDLKPSDTQEGAIVSVRSTYNSGAQGPARTISALTQANPGVVTTATHGFISGDTVALYDIVGMTQVNNHLFTVTVSSTTAFALNGENTTGYNAYVSGGRAHKVFTNIKIDAFRSADVGRYILLNGGVIKILSVDSADKITGIIEKSLNNATASGQWSLEDIIWDGSSSVYPTPAVTLTASATTGSDVVFTLGSAGFLAGDVGRIITHTAATGVAIITGFLSTTKVLATITTTFSTTSAISSGNWTLSGNSSIVNIIPTTNITTGSLGTALTQYNQTINTAIHKVNISAISKANPCVITTSTNHGFVTGNTVRIHSTTSTYGTGIESTGLLVAGLVAPDANVTYTITVLSATTFNLTGLNTSTASGSYNNTCSVYASSNAGTPICALAVDGSGASPRTFSIFSRGHGLSTGTSVFITGINTSLAYSNLVNDKYTTITTIDADNFTIDNIIPNDVPFAGYYGNGGYVYIPIVSGTSLPFFRVADDEDLYSLNDGNIRIKNIVSTSSITTEIILALSSSNSSTSFTFIPEVTGTGFPRTVAVHQQRLLYGGSDFSPKTIWGSEIGNFTSFGVGPDDEDSIEFILVAKQAFTISWMTSNDNLIVGTTLGEFVIDSGSANTSISPSAIDIRLKTYYGSNLQQPLNVKDEVIFNQIAENKIRSYIIDPQSITNGYEGEDITFVGNHLFTGGIKRIAYAKEPKSILYALTNSGILLSGTYDRKKKIAAWTKVDTDGYVEDINVIEVSGISELWMIVRRKINGLYSRYIEVTSFATGTEALDSFLDSYLILSTPITITNISQSNPGVVTAIAHGLTDGDTVILKGIIDPLSSELDSDKTNMSSLNNSVFTVDNATTDTFELSDAVNINTSAFNAYGSAGSVFLCYTTIIGLEHLEGKEVSIRADGSVELNKTVTSGSIELESPAGEVIIGLPYQLTATLLAQPYDIGLGSMLGQRARWVRPKLYVVDSTNPTIEDENVPTRSTGNLMDQAVPLYTGYLDYGPMGSQDHIELTFTNNEPLPVYIIGITGTVESGVN